MKVYYNFVVKKYQTMFSRYDAGSFHLVVACASLMCHDSNSKLVSVRYIHSFSFTSRANHTLLGSLHVNFTLEEPPENLLFA